MSIMEFGQRSLVTWTTGLIERIEAKEIQMRDTPKPNVICPECGHKEAFFHCALKDNEGNIYDWGKVVTCLRCKTPFNIHQNPELLEQENG